MRTFWHGPARGCVLLCLVWLCANALPLVWLAGGRYDHWEVVEARKLLDYGFWARHGAMLDAGTYVGRLANPGDYNYAHHPYPLFWLDTLLYWLFGKVGVYTLTAAVALAGSLLTY